MSAALSLHDGSASFILRGDFVAALAGKAEVGQVQSRLRRPPDRLDEGVVPHAASVEKARRNEEGRLQAMPGQYRQCHVVVVGIAVIEGDRQRALGQGSFAQAPGGVVERQHVEERLHPPAHVIEVAGIDLHGKQRVRSRQDAMQDQDRQAPLWSGRRRHAKELAQHGLFSAGPRNDAAAPHAAFRPTSGGSSACPRSILQALPAQALNLGQQA